MSAWVVSHDHIDALLTFTKDRTMDRTETGRLLLKENVRSVAHRYPGDSEADLPGKCGETADGYKFRYFEPFSPAANMPAAKKAAWVLKACQCFDYQSCETDDYEQSAAWKIIRSIESEAIMSLPHYEQAPWGIDRERLLNPQQA